MKEGQVRVYFSRAFRPKARADLEPLVPSYSASTNYTSPQLPQQQPRVDNDGRFITTFEDRLDRQFVTLGESASLRFLYLKLHPFLRKDSGEL